MPLLRIAVLTLALVAPAASQGHTFVPNLIYATVLDQFGGTWDLNLDLYIPNGLSATAPCVVWIHGGGWQTGSRFPANVQDVANAGYVVASIDYRLSWQMPWPAQIHDCKGAVRWLRANASTYNIDPDRIGAWGSSAGGHLAAFLGVSGGLGTVRVGQLSVDLEGVTGGNLGFSSRVQAVYDWYGPTDFLRMSQYPSNLDHDSPTSPEAWLVAASIQTAPEAVRSANPIAFISHEDPPMVIQHGTTDHLVPYDQGAELFRVGREDFGLDWSMVTVQNGGHGGAGFSRPDVTAFFDVRLMNTPATTVSVTSSGAVPEAGGAGTFTVSRVGAMTQALPVRLAFVGTAIAGEDFVALPTVATIPAGAASITLVASAVPDLLVEGDEIIRVALRPSSAYRLAASATTADLVLVDDDAAAGLPVVEVGSVNRTATEGGGAATFRVTRTGPTTSALTVRYRMGGTAIPGLDHDLLAGDALIAAGASFADLVLTPVDDASVEFTEMFSVELLPGPDYAVGANPNGSGRLYDDDRTPALPLVNAAATDDDPSEPAAVGGFKLYRTGDVSGSLTVNVVAVGTAGAGIDYQAIAPTVTFPAGQNWQRVFIQPIDDALLEGDEYVTLFVLPGAGYQVGAQPSRRFLLQDDEAVVPATAPVMLDVPAVVLGRPASFTIGGAPGTPYELFVSFAPAYLPISPYPVLVDLFTLTSLGNGTLSSAGSGVVTIPLPESPVAGGIELWFQALTLPGGGVALTNRAVRRLHFR